MAKSIKLSISFSSTNRVAKKGAVINDAILVYETKLNQALELEIIDIFKLRDKAKTKKNLFIIFL